MKANASSSVEPEDEDVVSPASQLPLNPQHFATFLAVVDAGGKVSIAARMLQLSQPGVTHQLNELEKRLGVVLLDRARGRAARVTRAGRVFERYARSIVGMQSALYADLDQLKRNVSGVLSFGASSGVASTWLTAHLAAFSEQYPGVVPNVTVEDARSIISRVAAGGLELGVVGGSWNDQSVLFEKVHEAEAVVIASPQNVLAEHAAVKLDELRGSRIALPSQGSGLRMALQRMFAVEGVPLAGFDVVGEFGDHAGVANAVQAFECIGIVWRSCVQDALDLGKLIVLDVDLELNLKHCLVYRRDRRLSRRAAALVDSLRRAHVARSLEAASEGT